MSSPSRSSSSVHPSSSWQVRAYESERGSAPADPERFAALMARDEFPRASSYDPVWVWGNQMGPNVLWLTESLAEVIVLEPGMRVLDMGCGTAISSIFLAREFGVEVWAADLWVPAADNFGRIREAGLIGQVHAVHADALAYPFEPDFFDAAISVDAYHYWGGEADYVDSIASFVKPGGTIGIIVPGDAMDAASITYDGEEITTFHSAAWWQQLWARSEQLDVQHAEMLSRGWELWWQFVEAEMAWSGTDDAGPEGTMLLNNHSLGFSRVVAHRRGRLPNRDSRW